MCAATTTMSSIFYLALNAAYNNNKNSYLSHSFNSINIAVFSMPACACIKPFKG